MNADERRSKKQIDRIYRIKQDWINDLLFVLILMSALIL